ncbi:surface-adhesin E family protein [Sphingomonas sp. GB1N7]|uniref:surface-adhesin E family protein n=1 Tax=Parasphingomonas caseinilytica TaxID=3096158 RepID=UPI002FC9B5B9
MIGLAAIAAMMSGVAAEGRNIVFVAGSFIKKNQRNIVVFDQDSIRKSSPNRARAWSYHYVPLPTGERMMMASLDAFDCDLEKTQNINSKFYNFDGTYRSEKDNDSEKWTYIAPGTIQNLLMELVCGKAPEAKFVIGDVDALVALRKLSSIK